MSSTADALSPGAASTATIDGGILRYKYFSQMYITKIAGARISIIMSRFVDSSLWGAWNSGVCKVLLSLYTLLLLVLVLFLFLLWLLFDTLIMQRKVFLNISK